MTEVIHATAIPVHLIAEALVLHPDGDRILLVRKPNGCTLPGGGVESGESIAAAAQRETLEETTVGVTVTGVAAIAEQHRASRLILFFTMRADFVEGSPRVGDDDDGEILEAFWAPLADADDLIPWLAGLDLSIADLARSTAVTPYRFRIEGQR